MNYIEREGELLNINILIYVAKYLFCDIKPSESIHLQRTSSACNFNVYFNLYYSNKLF